MKSELWFIGNPENRRYAFFCAAAERLGLARPRAISYSQLLLEQVSLAELITRGARVRLESPSENVAVEAELVRRGALLEHANDAALQQALLATQEHGRIVAPHWWYAGFCSVLQQVATALEPLAVRWMNHPAEIPVLFDKQACQQALAAQGIPTPAPLLTATCPALQGYADLRARMQHVGWRRAFVKLRYGSSASGVVALQSHQQQIIATTSVELVQSAGATALFNSLRVRRYTDERQVAAIIDELCRYGVQVEAWLPKAGQHGRTFDLRVMVIAGEVRQMVMRTSRGPITNLHLGNRRGDLERLLSQWPNAARAAALESCRRSAAIFPQSLYAGVDLALLPGLQRHAILEVNAFGDLLPGVLAQGDDTYTAELRALFT